MKKFFKEAKGHLMTGIGYMLPLIIGASLVVAIPKLIGVAMGINSLEELVAIDQLELEEQETSLFREDAPEELEDLDN